jgi:ABC-type transporter Mla subunit MlaD
VVLPDLSQLPPWAVVLFVVCLAIIVGLAWLGERMGRKAPPATDNARILGAVIDGKKADEMIAAFGRLSTRLAENTKALEANTASVASAEREIDEARTDIRELNREIAKSVK